MLLELAIGDAYGAGFEYAPQDLVLRYNTGKEYIKHPRHPIRPGSYTDDTQMSLAIAEALVAGDRWTPPNLAARFVEVFKRDPREGYAQGFYLFLQEVTNGEEFLTRIRPDSEKSGAAMRAVPLGILGSPAVVMDRATTQARITHATAEGVTSACVAALMSHYFLYDLGTKANLGKYLANLVPGPWAGPWHGKVGPRGTMAVHAAVTAVMAHRRLSDLLQACVAFTGDVDTVATIALGAAAHSREYQHDLAPSLFEGLENGPYGRDYLFGLDRRLLALMAR
jgi:ADP-ribosylglycohydrolase